MGGEGRPGEVAGLTDGEMESGKKGGREVCGSPAHSCKHVSRDGVERLFPRYS